MRRITFSRNYTISLSRTCQCYCKYCAFATHQAHIHPPDEVESRLDEAVRRKAKELLFLTGEKSDHVLVTFAMLAGKFALVCLLSFVGVRYLMVPLLKKFDGSGEHGLSPRWCTG